MKDKIAIIGMACVAPGAHNPEELWENVLAGRRYFRRAPDERLPRSEYFDSDPEAPGKTYQDQIAVITGWQFNPAEFNLPPITVNTTDLAHWLALFTAREAINDAGIKLEEIDKTRVGVILGNSLTGEFSRSHNMRFRWPFIEKTLKKLFEDQKVTETVAEGFIEEYRKVYETNFPEISEDSLAGNMSNVIPGRICNYFDFGAGGFAVDGACSSSLLSVVNGCNALVNGDMDIVLTGGVDISLDPFEVVGFAKTKALATEDIRPYDQGANGMLPGEGCGILILEREEDAIKNGHKIHAFVKGWGYSSDGKSGGITAPKVEGQMRALVNAYKKAGYPITSVQLIEGHGTGTPLGDTVELECIKRLLDENKTNTITRIGSVKANIGHCKSAAGAMGLIKAVMAVNRKIFPPSVNCDKPHKIFGNPLTNFVPANKAEIWASNGVRRRASISGMGFGGSNGHITIEESNPKDKPRVEDLEKINSTQSSEAILISANDRESLIKEIQKIAVIAVRICRAELTDLAATLANANPSGKFRLAVVANSPWHLEESLKKIIISLNGNRALDEINEPSEGIYIGEAKSKPKLVSLFPGQGSHFINMGEHLKKRYPFINEFYEEVDKKTKSLIKNELSQKILTDTLFKSGEEIEKFEQELRHTSIAQPAIVLSSMAMLRILKHFGIEPDYTIGHSLGEISALSAAGAFDDYTAVKIAALRGDSMSKLDIPDPGAMVAVSAAPEKVEKLISGFGNKELVIANYNSTRQTVVSGATSVVKDFILYCKKVEVGCKQLPVSHAFHSDIVGPASVDFGKQLKRLFSKNKSFSGDKAIISTSSGAILQADSDVCKLLSEHIRKPVRFLDAVNTAKAENPDLWIEIGPGGILTSLVKDILGQRETCLATDLSGDDGFDLMNRVLAQCFVLGFPVKTERIFDNRFYRSFDIESYDPLFITNPCERKIDINKLDIQPIELTSSGIFSEIENKDEFSAYLQERSNFIREFIGVDYRHHTGKTLAESTVVKNKAEKKQKGKDKETQSEKPLLEQAISWIAKKTGFPVENIKPEMKLSDDLNINSIKAGEMVVYLSKAAKVRAVFDPAKFANSRIIDIIETIEKDAGRSYTQQDLHKEQKQYIDDVFNTDLWIRSFNMKELPYPIEYETAQKLKEGDTVLIVSDNKSSWIEKIISDFKNQEIKTNSIGWSELTGNNELLKNANGLLIVLPELSVPFYKESPEEYTVTSETTILRVVNLFKSLYKFKNNNLDGFRTLIIRTYSKKNDQGKVLNAFAGLLKTLKLESKESYYKFLSLPVEWDAGKLAITLENEFQYFAERNEICYDIDGKRYSPTANPIILNGNTSQPFGVGDVVLVSGGGKGITFEHAFALAEKYKVKLALLGTSPMPVETTDKESELTINLKRLMDAGANFIYIQCDVCNTEQVRKAVENIEANFGKINAILHGAGISKFKFFHEKPEDEFLECFKVKGTGLYNLVHSIDLNKLKALHVISSVLGKTGMRSQADYTFSNAWLDGAVQMIKEDFPNIHCLSLGYSVWAGTGLGGKLGALDYLKTIGVKPIEVNEGIASYLQLTTQESSHPIYVITGRLSQDLESNLYPRMESLKGRFLERILRYVPQTELIAEVTLSHDTDLYLDEHIFEGTSIMPAVLEIEAMVQCTMQCAGKTEIPVLRDIKFTQPVIVPEDEKLIIRLFVVNKEPDSYHVVIRTENDNYSRDFIEALVIFSNNESFVENIDEFKCPVLGDPLPIDPENLYPFPLFQGKLLRRIRDFYKLENEKEAISTIEVPDGEHYYSDGLPSETYFFSPAVRDSCWQTGLMILPPGALPSHIEEIRIFKKTDVKNIIINRHYDLGKKNNEYTTNLAIWDDKGTLVETMKNVVLKIPANRESKTPEIKIKPIQLDRVESDLSEFLGKISHSIAFVEHSELQNELPVELNVEDVNLFTAKIPENRLPFALANLTAAKRAAIKFAKKSGKPELLPEMIKIEKRPNGQPHLIISNEYEAREFFDGIDVSLTDTNGFSVAFIGTAPVGIDIEPVEKRDAELWQGLLGRDGYVLARDLSFHTLENFDISATRVWTVIEAGQKANNLQRIIPQYDSDLGGPWILFINKEHEIITGLFSKNKMFFSIAVEHIL